MRQALQEDRMSGRSASVKRRPGRVVFIRDGVYVRRPPRPRQRDDAGASRTATVAV